ncbi:MAG: DUF72 domain-containing protein [Burkholderiaceae bacterium]
MQDPLFPELPSPSETRKPRTDRPARTARADKPEQESRADQAAPAPRGKVGPQPPLPGHQALAQRLPAQVRLGTSSWNFPGWEGLVWDSDYAEAVLSKHGLAAYAEHPLFRTVSLDRAFYRPLSALQYAAYAAQVPEHFRFVVKAPSVVADATVRGEDGRGLQANPLFLDAETALREFVRPALDGLGAKLGALVFQLSPLPPTMLRQLPDVLQRLDALLRSLPPLAPQAPDGVIAVEVRDPVLISPALVQVLRDAGATYCLGLHAKLPPIETQLPMLRALWPGPLVCRWNLHRRHGAYGYDDAKKLYSPFNKLVDPDPETRAVLARVMAATAGAGRNVYVTISNKAEGSSPLSVAALAEELVARLP